MQNLQKIEELSLMRVVLLKENVIYNKYGQTTKSGCF